MILRGDSMKFKFENRVFDVVIEKDEDGWFIADVPELQGCHTQAKTRKELMKNVKEVIELCLEEE